MTNTKSHESGFRYILAAAIVLASTGVFGTTAVAHDDATGVVKERMDTMKDLSKRMKSLKSLVRNANNHDAEQIAGLAREIQTISEQVESGFPEGSNKHPSEALPSIWQDWDRFTDLIAQMRRESELLEQVALEEDQRATLKQFVSLGKTCRGCHTDFRQKKE